ncbi:angiotensin II receptor type 2 L homeolog [Xenopus laevis]|uniref:Type-2 angiotensin II receptor n=1 Tax=Xenopus laevis TaxID=8355 RepID=Q6GN84_XENLA|nr:angiotensin II receptor type 2 L homeolog [Xenopus laevis]AAH73632.1 MGC82957 protein [Xenopus laevis]
MTSTYLNISSNVSDKMSCQNMTLTDHQPELMPVLYSIIFTFGIIGNCLVIVVFRLQGDLKSVASIYIMNLAVADLVFLATLPFWATYYAFGYNWLFGKVMCKISSSLLCLNLFASIFFISCMSVDRYLAVVYPFSSQRRTKHQACLVSISVWILAILSSIPTFYFRNAFYIDELGVRVCAMDFPKEEYSSWCVGMALMKIMLGFCAPVCVIGTCYLMIGIHLIRSKGPMITMQNRDRVLKIVTAIVMAFLICWFPFHALTFLDALVRMHIISNCQIVTFIEKAMPFCICMGFSNSCINPLLYCFVGNQFRENFRHLFLSKISVNINSQLNSSRKASDCKEQEPSGQSNNVVI